MQRRLPTALGLAAMLGIAAAIAGCGGQPQYTQEQHYDLVDCSLVGWGSRSLPRQACLDQGGVPL